MLRSLNCGAAIFFLLVSVCFLPQNALARRCPVKMPETLLSLYQNSDSIYIAAFDRLEEGKVIEENDDYNVSEQKKHFIISSTLKGESEKFLVLEDTEYRYKAEAPHTVEDVDSAGATEGPPDQADNGGVTETEAGTEPVSESFESGEEVELAGTVPQLTAGDIVLLFIRKAPDGDAPQLTDYRDGLKKMTPERLAAYEKRIGELNGIFAEKKVSHERLLEWLIHCAQDPLTRWEGTYELLSAVQQLEWRERAAERLRERLAMGEPVEVEASEPAETEEAMNEQGRRKNVDTMVVAKTIDPNQKQVLADILLERRSSETSENEVRGAVRGDRELLELIKRWGDPRLLNYLLSSLRAGAGEPYVRSDNMSTIADLLDDEEAASVAEKYQETVWEDDNEVVGGDEDEQESGEDESISAPERSALGGTPSDPEPVENTGAPEADAGPAAPAEAPVVKKQTYRELRDELMQRFLARCDKVISDREREKQGDLAR